MIWKKNIGEHNGSNFDIFNHDEFLFTATSDGTVKKLDKSTGRCIMGKKILIFYHNFWNIWG